jgi:hypothetical protein
VHDQAAGFALYALDSGEEARFEQHLRACPGCEDEVERLQTAAAALAFAADLPLPRPALRLRVLDVGGRVIALRGRRALPVLAAAATACAALVLGLQTWAAGRPAVAGLKAYALQGAHGSLLVSRTGEATMVVHGLPSPAEGTVYELWVVRGGRPVAAGFLRGRMAVLTQRVAPGASVAVSLEAAGGSRRPTGPLLVRAETA